ncbi:MAG: tRNA (adenosine(37)-N6)-threonylcarbamoyltransferase complex ATPase subunit type 1 TsaE [Candidatus Berkelbacteria bacterium]|nr:tRNA (adenosine(37)-N6)-threonylcarbamoyltransferase complex ATPase subunit type 1 TsaE [Candidatus Berkelbacteria bacterium]
MITISKSELKTQQFSQKLAKKLKGGEIIGLSGDLGSGKTTFAKGLAKGLGIKETITSPTFVLVKIYPLTSSLKPLSLVHIDLYRLKNIKDIKELGLEDYLKKQNYICVIEWPEKIKQELFKLSDNVIWITFKYIDKDTREIKIKGI